MRYFAEQQWSKIWESDGRSEPHILCYVSRRGTRRVQRGWSEAEKSFFILIILLQRDFIVV